MRKIFTLLSILFICLSGFGQGNFYFAYELGPLFERHHYTNEASYSECQYYMGGASALLFGFQKQSFTFETGGYIFISKTPYKEYDFNTGKINKAKENGYEVKNFVIPFRFGKEMWLKNSRFAIKPEIGISLFVKKGHVDERESKGWVMKGSEYYYNTDAVYIASEYTFARVIERTKIELGLETSVSFLYQINENFGVYFRGSYIAQFSPIYYEMIEHHHYDEVLNANSTKLNVALLQFGININVNEKQE